MKANNWRSLCETIGMSNPEEYFETRWLAFEAARGGLLARPVLEETDFAQTARWLGFEEGLLIALRHAANTIEQNEHLKEALVFLHWATFVDRPFYLVPWHEAPEPGIMGEERGLFAILLLLRQLPLTLKDLDGRALPNPKDVTDNFKSLNGFSKAYFKREGRWGMDNYFWNALCVTPYLNTVFYLRFNPTAFPWQFTMYRHRQTGKLLCLAEEGVELRRDGLALTDDEEPGFVTAYETYKDGSVLAHRVSPAGFVRPVAERFLMTEYEKLLGRGDVLLSFHIPTGPGYTIARCKQSFVEAFEYFDKHFPEVHPKGITCDSWLFSPQLQLLLDPDTSRIAAIQRESYLIPNHSDREAFATFVFGLDHMPDDPGDLRQNSSLHSLIRDHLVRGGHLCVGGMLLPTSGIESFGGGPYDKTEDLLEFQRLQTVEGRQG